MEKKCQRCPRGFRVTERLQRGRGQFLAALPQQISVPRCRSGLDIRLPGNLGCSIAQGRHPITFSSSLYPSASSRSLKRRAQKTVSVQREGPWGNSKSAGAGGQS